LSGLGRVSIAIQRLNLKNITYDVLLHDILAQVRGRWTGAIYIREFYRPDGKPYVFLGRHRVVVRRSSRLHEHLLELRTAGRLSRLAMTIHELTEDDAGFTSKSLEALL
jgi:hypothetical protein